MYGQCNSKYILFALEKKYVQVATKTEYQKKVKQNVIELVCQNNCSQVQCVFFDASVDETD